MGTATEPVCMHQVEKPEVHQSLRDWPGHQTKVGKSGSGEPGWPFVDPLSARELEVLVLLARGHTNQQIAAMLVIAIETVKRHVSNIHSKLGVCNRTQAAARALDLGLLSVA